jgi:hypothetical protein
MTTTTTSPSQSRRGAPFSERIHKEVNGAVYLSARAEFYRFVEGVQTLGALGSARLSLPSYYFPRCITVDFIGSVYDAMWCLDDRKCRPSRSINDLNNDLKLNETAIDT